MNRKDLQERFDHMNLTFQDYDALVSDVKTPHTGTFAGVVYNGLALTVEAGHLADYVRTCIMNGTTDLSGDMCGLMLSKLGDALLHLTKCAADLGFDLETVARANSIKVHSRQRGGGK